MSPGHLESARHRAGWWNPAGSVTRPPGSCTPSPVWGPCRPRQTFPFFLRRPRPLLPALAPLGCRCCLDSARGAGRGRGPSCGCGAGASAKPAGRGWQHCAGAVGRGRPRRSHRLCGFGVSPKPSSLSPSGPRRLSLRHTCCQPAAQGRPTPLFAWSASPRARLAFLGRRDTCPPQSRQSRTRGTSGELQAPGPSSDTAATCFLRRAAAAAPPRPLCDAAPPPAAQHPAPTPHPRLAAQPPSSSAPCPHRPTRSFSAMHLAFLSPRTVWGAPGQCGEPAWLHRRRAARARKSRTRPSARAWLVGEGKGPGSVSPSLLCTQVLPRPDLSPRRAQETRLRGQRCETL